MFRLAYNTNGLAHHRVLDAFRLLSELGYEGVALTPDVGQLDPYLLEPRAVAEARRWLDELGLEVAVETGARFLLDARKKHAPNLLDADAAQRERRVDFYRRCLDMAAELGAPLVSLWAGTAPDGATLTSAPDEQAELLLDRLARGLDAVLGHARGLSVQVAFEPEPGMFVERPAGYQRLVEHMGAAADELGLTLDVGHCVVTGDEPVSGVIRTFARRLVHVHLDDCPRGSHEHRMFGEGDLDLEDTLAALIEIGFEGLAAVELSRDAHRGAEAAAEALRRLRTSLSALS